MIDMTHHGNVTVLRMAHGKANALDLELCEALTSQLDECQRSPSIGALVLTGTGRMFSAGAGLPRAVDGGAPLPRVVLPPGVRTFHQPLAFPLPVLHPAYRLPLAAASLSS